MFRIKLRKILEIIHAKFTISDGKWVILVTENLNEREECPVISKKDFYGGFIVNEHFIFLNTKK